MISRCYMVGNFFRMQSRILIRLVVGCVIVAACRKEPVSPKPVVNSPQASRGIAGKSWGVSSPTEELYRRVGALAPSFGGFYLDNSGDPTVVLLDPTPATLTATRAVMDQVFGPKFEQQFNGHAWQAVQGQFNYVDLANWRDTIATHIASLSRVISGVGIDQMANRVNVGLRDTTNRARAETLIVQLGVPLKGIVFQHGMVPRFGSTINDRTRGIPAGYQVVIAGSICTLGANAVDQYPLPTAYYFIVNAHCADPNQIPQFHRDAPGYQPGTADTNFIGHEVSAGPFDTTSPGCTPADGVAGCSEADVALIAYNSPSYPNFGYLAVMASPPASGFHQGTLQVAYPDSVQTIDQVEGYENSPPVVFNQQIYRLGASSGFTSGVVTNTCYTATTINNVVARCHVLVYGAYANLGDSGGTVFYYEAPNNSVPKLFGIFSLIYDNYGYGYYPMSKIYPALGIDPNTTLFCGC